MKNKRLCNLKSGLLLTISLLISAVSFAQTAANFTGTWTFDESKSNLGEGGFRMNSQEITITQDANVFKIERSFPGQGGEEMKTEETYTLDGKESVNPVFNTSKKSTATFSADKKSLTVSSVMVFEMNGEQNEIKTVEIYKLADADKTLSIDTQSTSSMGERKTSLLYNKK